jgi:hypothetical protein
MSAMRWDVVASVGVVVIGWTVGHWLNARRDLANKRRELRVQYLIEAWRKIEKAVLVQRPFLAEKGHDR